jgi:hypothetical protein
MATTLGLYAMLACMLTTTVTPRWTVTVDVENRANFSPSDLSKAERWTEKNYGGIGIKIVLQHFAFTISIARNPAAFASRRSRQNTYARPYRAALKLIEGIVR